MNETNPRPIELLAGSLKGRLALLVALGTLIVALTWGLYLQQRLQQEQRLNLERQTQVLAKALADAIDGDLLRRDYAVVEELAHHLVDGSSIIELAVTDREGQLLVAVRAEPGQRPQPRLGGQLALPSEPRRFEWLDGKRLIVWQAVGDTPHSGWLRFEMLVERLFVAPSIFSAQLLLALLVVTVLGLGLQLLLAWPSLAQLAQLAGFAEHLPHQPGRQLTCVARGKELVQLCTALNALSSLLAQQQAQLDRVRRRLALRQRVFELLATGGALNDLLSLIVEEVEQERPEILASILLVDPGSQSLRLGAAPRLPQFFNQAIDGLAVAEGASSCGTAAFRRQPIYVAEIASHPLWQAWKALAERAGVAACWSEPILSARGETLGVLAFYLRQPAEPEDADRRLLREMAHLSSVVIERKRLDEELLLASSVYQSSGEAMFVTDAENRIVAVNPAFTQLTGYSADEVLGKDPSFLSSERNSPALYRTMQQALEATGHWQGEIWNRRRNGEEFAEWLSISSIRDASGRLLRRIGLFSDLTEIKRAEELIWQQANYDVLTGLPNRRLFRDRLKQEMRRTSRLAVLMIDLDHFKTVNEAFGQSFGDKVLIEAAKRIGAQTGENDTVARLSGDGFAVIMPGVYDPTAVERVASSIVSTIGQSFVFDGESAFVAASIGITLYPDDATDLEALLRNAEQAMYVAKQGGRGGFAWFTNEMQLASQVRRDLVRDLRGALAARQFEVYYQPIVDLRSGQIVKAEALLRWQHPERGAISPTTFIPMAEELGLIDEIGNWVFGRVLDQLTQWDALGLPPIQISVNKSPRQFHANGEMPWLVMLEQSGLAGERLVIEITEGLLLGDRPEVFQTLEAYRAAGLEIALDDFGTGYSSLSYLQRFDIDYLKIDRAFVRHLSDNAASRSLTDAMIAMAHKLGLNVVAEGVEEPTQRDFLAAMGCDLAQGYLFARPLPPEELASRLAAMRSLH